MHKISARQPFVPGLLDISEDEPLAQRTGIDAWTVFAAFVVAGGIGLLVFCTTGAPAL
jgi:hypothetical protein